MSPRPDGPSLSVVIPCYNRERTIARAVDSALAQQHPPLEVLVVDDGSRDRSAEIVRGLRGPVRCISQPNAGVAHARNRGVELAAGEWIAFLDSDDFWYPEHLGRIAAAIRATEAGAALYFADLRLADGTTAWGTAGFALAAAHELRMDATPWVLLPRQPMTWPATVVRRRDYLELGGQLESLRVREDTHFYLRIGLGRPLCAVAGCAGEATADGEVHERLTSAPSAEYWDATVRLYADVLRRGGSLGPDVRRELVHRLAAGHLRAARLALERGDWARALAHVARAGVRAPRQLASAVARRLRGAREGGAA